SEAAITSPIAGTTRDVLLRSVGLEGVPFQFIDMAGLREEAGDAIEEIGIARARAALEGADLVLWLGPEGEGPGGAWEIEAQVDRAGHVGKAAPRHRVSAMQGEGMAGLVSALAAAARHAMPAPGEAAVNARQHRLLAEAHLALARCQGQGDLLLVAEDLRAARVAFDRLLGRSTTEDMLDTLFGRFCIGK
ncbi:MAG TPA: GTPase, partial [Novosphingobium sp.]|nr:GTPase [Novosphingobium sp.]